MSRFSSVNLLHTTRGDCTNLEVEQMPNDKTKIIINVKLPPFYDCKLTISLKNSTFLKKRHKDPVRLGLLSVFSKGLGCSIAGSLLVSISMAGAVDAGDCGVIPGNNLRLDWPGTRSLRNGPDDETGD